MGSPNIAFLRIHSPDGGIRSLVQGADAPPHAACSGPLPLVCSVTRRQGSRRSGHPDQFPYMAIRVFEAAILHETMILLRIGIGDAAGLGGLINDTVHVGAIQDRQDNQYRAGLFGVGNWQSSDRLVFVVRQSQRVLDALSRPYCELWARGSRIFPLRRRLGLGEGIRAGMQALRHHTARVHPLRHAASARCVSKIRCSAQCCSASISASLSGVGLICGTSDFVLSFL